MLAASAQAAIAPGVSVSVVAAERFARSTSQRNQRQIPDKPIIMGLVISLMPAFIPATPWAYGTVVGFVGTSPKHFRSRASIMAATHDPCLYLMILVGSGYWVFYYLSVLLSPVLFPHAFANLDTDPHKNRGYQAEWHTRVSSSAHAIAQLAGVYHFAMNSAPHRADRVNHYDARLFVEAHEGPTGLGPEFFCALFSAYLIADIIPVYIYRDTMANINARQRFVEHFFFRSSGAALHSCGPDPHSC